MNCHPLVRGGLFAAVLCAVSLAAADELLLSDNAVGNALDAKVRRAKTGAAVEWVTDGPYAANEGFLKTAVRSDNGRSRLLDGNAYGDGNASCFGSWRGSAYCGTFTINLNAPYLVGRVTLWSAQTERRGIESFTVLLSRDGRNFVEAGKCVIPAASDGVEEKLVRGVPLELALEKPAIAQYVRIRARKRLGRMSAVLAEAAVWGVPVPKGADIAAMSPENRRPVVPLRVTGIGSGAAALDWSGFAAASAAKGYRLYRARHDFSGITAEGVEKIADLPEGVTRKVIFPLNPGEAFHYGVTAVYGDGEYPEVKSVAFVPPEPFAYGRFRDMLGICHFWTGGGAAADRLPDAWREVVLDMLATSPFRSIRWWSCPPEIVKKFYEHGIEVTARVNKQCLAVSEQTGIRLFSSRNEPHLQGVGPEKMAEIVRGDHDAVRKINPRNRLYAPTVGLDRHSVEYAGRFYAAGAKDFFDAFDLHSYIGTTTDFRQPEGYPPGSPEALFGRVAEFKAVMARYGDSEKPLFCSEFGYTDCNTANPSGSMTPERKAEWLVRGMIIHNVLGFRRVYLYSFYDEGSDPDYTEHHFGIVSRDLQKKPAFYALKVLADVLGDTVLAAPMKGVEPPNFGYCYRNVDVPGCVSVIWNGAGERSGRFKTAPGNVEVVSMMGERRRISTRPDGSFLSPIGGAPVYFVAAQPVELLSSEPIPESAPTGTRLSIAKEKNVLIVPSGTVPEAVFRLKNPSGERWKAALSLAGGTGNVEETRMVELPPGEELVERFRLPVRSGFALERYRLTANYDTRLQSCSDETDVWVRRLSADTGKVELREARFSGLGTPVWLLSNDELELAVDAERGGMILEWIDKRTLADQITSPRGMLDRIDSAPFHYCVWDSVRLPSELRGKISFNRRTPYRLTPMANGLRLSAGKPKLFEVEKQLTLDGAALVWKTVLSNRCAVPVACSWYLHPEYTVGGSADSFSDFLVLPQEKGENKLLFWSGLGEKRMPPSTAGWWRLEDPVAKYRILQTYSPEQFRNPRIWFGIGCCNVEMESVPLTLAPGRQWSGTLRWSFEFPAHASEVCPAR